MKLSELVGLIPDDQGEAMAALAAQVRADQVIVELGSFKGKSTCYLATGAREGNGAHVVAVDAWTLKGNTTGRFGYAEPSTQEAFLAQLESQDLVLGRDVTAIQAFSDEAGIYWDGPIVGLLYIDADHSYDAVWRDFWSWWPHLAEGATVAFDDWRTPHNPGVERAVSRLEYRGHLRNVRIVAERLAVGEVK